MSLTVTDLFAGFGGASTGAIAVPGVEIKIAANHWELAVEVHNLNHQETDHACVDLHLEDPRFFPKTDILWASPECTKWSQAGGANQPALGKALGDWTLFDKIDEDLLADEEDEATRSRLLMFDVLRFIDHHRYAGVIVENVVDIATNKKYAAAWRAWQQGLINLDYEFKVVSLNSMHAQAVGDPAPQSRDRLYVVAWPKGNRAPDIERFIRPKAWCATCETIVESRQAWKNGRTIGKYRQQYVYVCNCCHALVEPAWLPASSAIDWSLEGERIGDRKRPLAEKTRARIAAGIARYWHPLVVEAQGNTYDAADPKHRNHGDPNGYYRAWPTEEALRTLTTDPTKALVVPVEGRDGKKARSDAEALRTMTTRAETGLAMHPFLTQFRERVRDLNPEVEPLPTVVADGANHGLVGPPFMLERRFEYRTRSLDDPLSTLTGNETTKGVVGPPPFIAELRGGGSDARSVDDPLSTFCASGGHHGLVVTNNFANRGRDTDEPLPTLTTAGGGGQALVTPYYGSSNSAKPTDEPIGTLTTRDRYALIQRHNSGGAEMLTPADEVFRTFTSKGHQSIVTPGDVEAAEAMVDDCTFRMLQPHEIGAGMAFPLDYLVKGTKRDQVKGYGNAVTPPAARDLVAALAESLGHEVAA